MINIHLLMLINGGIATVSSILLNSLLGWLVINYTASQMKGYSRLILMHCVADVIFDCTSFVIGPLTIPLKAEAYNILQGFFIDNSPEVTLVLYSLSTWISMTAILLASIDFIYRYLSVCKNHELTTCAIFFMAFLCYLVVWIFAFPVSWICLKTVVGPTPETSSYTAVLKQIPEWSDSSPAYVLNFKDPSKPDWIVSIYAAGIDVFSVLVIIYTSIRIHFAIKSKTDLANNPKAIKIHKQVTRILIVQAALPIIVIVGPAAALLTVSLMQFSVPLIGLYSALTTMWFSSLKPFLTILIIERYRKQVASFICRNKSPSTLDGTSRGPSSSAPVTSRSDTRKVKPKVVSFAV